MFMSCCIPRSDFDNPINDSREDTQQNSKVCQKGGRFTLVAGCLAGGIAGTDKMYYCPPIAGIIFSSSLVFAELAYEYTGSMNGRKVINLMMNVGVGGLAGIVSMMAFDSMAPAFKGKAEVAMVIAAVSIYAMRKLNMCCLRSCWGSGIFGEWAAGSPRQYEDSDDDDDEIT